MKELKAEFIREEPTLYDTAVKKQTIDYYAFMRSQIEECMRREEKDKAKAKTKVIQDQAKAEIEFIQNQAIEEIDAIEAQAKKEIKQIKDALLKTCDLLIRFNYKEDNNSWLKYCTIKELNKIIVYTQEDESHDYNQLMNFIFAPNTTNMPNR